MTLRLGPVPRTSMVTDSGRPFVRVWIQWLSDLVKTLGWNKDVPMYRGVFYTEGGLSSAHGGDTDFTFQLRLPNDYQNGTPLEFYCEWAIENAGPVAPATANIVLKETIQYGVPGDVMALEPIESLTVAVPNAAGTLVRTSFTALKNAYAKGTVFTGQVTRRGGVAADDYADEVVFFMVGLKYQAEGIGTEVAHP